MNNVVQQTSSVQEVEQLTEFLGQSSDYYQQKFTDIANGKKLQLQYLRTAIRSSLGS